MWSSFAGGSQTFDVALHKALSQSASTRQLLPVAHPVAVVGPAPPQSTSVSVPFFRPSSFAAGLQTFVTSSHLTLSQSVVTSHALPTAHRGAFVGAPPPQSTSLSVPFLT